MTSYEHVDTAAMRPATGLDVGARHLMMKVVEDAIRGRRGTGSTPQLMVGCLFHDRYGGLPDYMEAVASVWGEDIRFRLANVVTEARAEVEYGTDSLMTPNVADLATAAALDALLAQMPEPDFRLAVELTLRYVTALEESSSRLTAICQARGIPWRVDPQRGFEWVGDETVEREVMRPALTILNDRRFVPGVSVEFEQARVELKIGTPQARKQVLTEASSAVESAMKVVLIERGIGHAAGDAAQKLFQGLRDAGLVAADTESTLLAVPRARNKRGGHGAGPVAHDVDEAEAEAFIAAAATAITFLGKLLP